MASRKKIKPMHSKDGELSYDEAVESLAEIVADELQGHAHTALDPFDTYADTVKERVKGDMTKFRSRFANGYHILLEELSKENREKRG